MAKKVRRSAVPGNAEEDQPLPFRAWPDGSDVAVRLAMLERQLLDQVRPVDPWRAAAARVLEGLRSCLYAPSSPAALNDAAARLLAEGGAESTRRAAPGELGRQGEILCHSIEGWLKRTRDPQRLAEVLERTREVSACFDALPDERADRVFKWAKAIKWALWDLEEKRPGASRREVAWAVVRASAKEAGLSRPSRLQDRERKTRRG